MNREVYLRLASASFGTFGVRTLAYCLMTNHVHWVVSPVSAQARARAVYGR
jgi:REP element-mobilizing transposase RayT